MRHGDASTEKFYAEFWSSEEWGGATPNGDEKLRLRAILEFIETIPASSAREILDVGCGRGWLSSQLRRHGNVLGIDPTKAAVEAAQKLFPGITFEAETAEGLISRGYGEHFDLIVSSEVIEHVPREEQGNFLRHIASLAKPGARVILTTPRGELWERWLATEPKQQPVEAWLTERQLKGLASSAGLKVIGSKRVGCDYLDSTASRITRTFGRVPGVLRLMGPFVRSNAIYQVVLLHRS